METSNLNAGEWFCAIEGIAIAERIHDFYSEEDKRELAEMQIICKSTSSLMIFFNMFDILQYVVARAAVNRHLLSSLTRLKCSCNFQV